MYDPEEELTHPDDDKPRDELIDDNEFGERNEDSGGDSLIEG